MTITKKDYVIHLEVEIRNQTYEFIRLKFEETQNTRWYRKTGPNYVLVQDDLTIMLLEEQFGEQILRKDAP